MLDDATLILVLTALLAWLNARLIRLPTAMGVMFAALVLSLATVGLSHIGLGVLEGNAKAWLRDFDFSAVLMQGMLSFLLFAGALHVDMRRLAKYRWQIVVLAFLGTVASTVIVGYGAWEALALSGVALPFGYALIFGALISPTDPIAVLDMLKTTSVPENLKVTLAAESLFNDGVGVVLFTLILAWLVGGDAPTLAQAVTVFARETLGGIVFGLVIGGIAYAMVRSIDDAHVEILVTIALVLGGYTLAQRLHVSGPIAMVVAGLLIGNEARRTAMSDSSRAALDTFWAVIDSILNAVLFVLMGFEVVAIDFPSGWLHIALFATIVTVGARAVSVGIPVSLFRKWFALPSGSARILTWGGLRGAISIALALSLPSGHERDLVVMLTYCVVVFSILGQGLTIAPLARRIFSRE